ncbi:uncharacterized protein LODBEIA_P59980 [Lodderomyces beijingensis]|uniref:Uncharacterized protein n=1 Tax=Lodderomyces beijingensis TaxID=1775926 RepID=A0ABP0ZUG1_9ASCO
MSSPSRSPSLSRASSPKTSIIISNLEKEDFVKPAATQQPRLGSISKNLSLVDQIKLSVLNSREEIIQHITYWSVLPFLHRVIIIFNDESTAKVTLSYLTELLQPYRYIKISLQENLLQRSKSQDQLDSATTITNDHLNVKNSLANFRSFHNDPKNQGSASFASEYVEPAPAQFNALSDLSKLGINLRDYNSDEQLNDFSNETTNTSSTTNVGGSSPGRSKSPSSLTPELNQQPPGRSDVPLARRSTKTLFKPELRLKTDVEGNLGGGGAKNPSPAQESFPASPTITLDETF